MTWGSNATFNASRCPFCGGVDIDDTDSGPSSHQRACKGWVARRRCRRLGTLALLAAVVMVLWFVWEAVRAVAGL